MAPTLNGSGRKVTLPAIAGKKAAREQIIQFAVSNYRQARVADRVGADIVVATDAVAMTELGRPNGLTLDLAEMKLFGEAVARGTTTALTMVTMPYWSYHSSIEKAVENAGWLIQNTGVEALECEGNVHHAPAIAAIVKAGIPVQAHIGLTSMRIPQIGGLRAQGKTVDRAKEIIDDAWAMVDAGCFSVLCEITTEELTQHLAEILPVPVISIGAGRGSDGSAIVVDDILGLYEEHVPRHVKLYSDLITSMETAMAEFVDDVRSGEYPQERHVVQMSHEVNSKFRSAVSSHVDGRTTAAAQ
ncbi:hypothetical protein BTO20_00805 [Mycobacterium dioxanotrophicus]|uniref:3-methyl-2-oxobutanoate hydroxymethyltransferase n=2 Tax=Mycobacterium dioxanotrophicus TaxID=482462 RepID=A0A1Y0BWQ0_9MYCO|nr:hypothetical protein BTO20_00805 [Mycobacterium dioxanotrophicus]